MLTCTNIKKYLLAYVLALLFLLLSPVLQAAATINVSVDREPVVLNEQFTLLFSADAPPDAEPDFSNLKQDFDILQQGKSSSVKIINGKMSQTITWTLQLFPKRAGKIDIPVIHFGSDKTESMQINVLAQAASQQTGQQLDDIIVEAEVETKTAYVQQQIVYVQRLYFARDFFDNATLSTPQLKAGKIDLEKLEAGREYTTTKQGRQYKVIERRYAIFPIQSGALEIAPTFFEGRLIDTANRQPNFGFFNRPTGKVVRRYSDPISIEVKPQAAAYTGKHWLPASRLTLHSRWSSPPETAKTGDPLTLTLSIIANGLRAEQLPQLEVNVPTGLKTYNDQPILNNESNSDGIVGTRQEKIVVIATAAGTFEIPAINLNWWDNTQTKQQIATLPAITLTATGVAANNNAVVPPSAATNTVNKAAEKNPTNSGENVHNSNTAPTNSAYNSTTNTAVTTPSNDDFWFYFSLFLLFILLLVIYLLWQQLRETLPAKHSKLAATNPSLNNLREQINTACKNQNHKALRLALCRWGSHIFQQPNLNLHTLVDQLSDRDAVLKTEIQQLMKLLYASENIDWNSQHLCKAIQQYTPEKVPQKQSSRIASLYPE